MAKSALPRLLLLAALLATLATGGCSRIRILYAQADWLILGALEERVPLTEAQRERLETEIAALLDWHCRTELPSYNALIGEIATEIESGRATTERVAVFGGRIQDFGSRILDRAVPALARLLADQTPAQTDEMYARLQRENAKSQRRIARTTPKKIADDYRDNASEQLERWLGPLNPAQERIIADWSRAVQPLGLESLEYRQALQAQLREPIDRYRGDPAGMESALRTFIARIPRERPSVYARRLAQNESASYAMIATALAAIDEVQREHLRGYAGRLRSDISGIECGE